MKISIMKTSVRNVIPIATWDDFLSFNLNHITYIYVCICANFPICYITMVMPYMLHHIIKL